MSNRLQIILEALNRTDPGFKAVGSGLDAIKRSVFSLKGALVGLVGGVSFGAMIQNTVRQEAAMAQLEVAVRSTGGAAGYTAAELAKMAGQMQAVTTYGDEVVMEGQSLLLTFTRIGRDVFPAATEAMLDMAERMGGDLKGSALQLGKALNDPIQGISALARAGVQFSERQKKTIESLVETGRTADAQRVILAELQTQFGGSARAARETFGGSLKALRNAFGDLLEAKGGLPEAQERIERLTGTLSDPNVQRGADQLMSTLITGVTKLVEVAAKVPDWLVKAEAFRTGAAVVEGPNERVDTARKQLAQLRAELAQEEQGLASTGTKVGKKLPWEIKSEQRIAALREQIRLAERNVELQRKLSGTESGPTAGAGPVVREGAGAAGETDEQRKAREKAEEDAFKRKIQYAADVEAMRAAEEGRQSQDTSNHLKGEAVIREQARQAIERERQAREGAIAARLAELDLMEQERSVPRLEATAERISLQRELLAIQAEHQAQLDKMKDPAGWYAQQDAIDATRQGLTDLQRQMLELTGSLGEGMGDAFELYLRDAETQFQQGVRLAEATAMGMEGAFSSFFFDAMQGKLKDLGDYVQAFLADVARAISQVMAQQMATSIISGVAGAFGGAAAGAGGGVTGSSLASTGSFTLRHDGGPILPRFHLGGLLPDEVPAILQTGERVLSREQNRTFEKLAGLLDGGALGGGTVVQVINNGPGEARTERGRGPDGRELIKVIIDEVDGAIGRGRFDRTFGQTFGLNRQGATRA
ncbi:MAG: phage tail length tape measure family protein [Desulfuromonadales bacterium]|nr:phage tail length tape measure family protein [Desulfuromonadales bacterium]